MSEIPPRPRFALPAPAGDDPTLFDPCRLCGGSGRVDVALEADDLAAGAATCPACGGSGAMPPPAG